MRLICTAKKNAETVCSISQSVISEEYPKYYPAGAVKMFSDLHSLENIRKSISADRVFLIESDGIIVGTVTIEKNHISRFFILSEFQGKGIGSSVMDEVERIIFSEYGEIVLDASLPAQSMYLRRGYIQTEYIKYKCENGDFLCYNIMKKTK